MEESILSFKGRCQARDLWSTHAVNDPLFRYHRWKANLRVLEIDEIKTVPYVRLSHPFVERLIGTIRREYLDQLFFWNANDRERKLIEFKHYYNRDRVDDSLDRRTPVVVNGDAEPPMANLRNYSWRSYANGLFQAPITA